MAPAEVHEQTEIERVERWRLQQLERAGYPKRSAETLAARHDIDLRHAVELLERGCPPELALKILV